MGFLLGLAIGNSSKTSKIIINKNTYRFMIEPGFRYTVITLIAVLIMASIYIQYKDKRVSGISLFQIIVMSGIIIGYKGFATLVAYAI